MQLTYMTDILFDALEGIMQSGMLLKKKIVFFGLNAPAFCCKNYLAGKGMEVFAFVDNNVQAVNRYNDPAIKPTFHHMSGDRRIVAFIPGELPEEYRDEYVFLLYSKYEDQMIEQLVSMGYRKDKQIIVVGGFWRTEELKRSIVPDNAGRLLNSDDVKKRQLDALRYIHRKCEENGLRYFIHYGTLLGSVRHGGYIPWDDDIDLLMSVSDLNKLIDIVAKENGRYGFFYASLNDPCRHFIAKLEDGDTIFHQWDIPLESFGGMVALDIFPMGGMPGDYEEALGYYNEVLEKALAYDDITVEFPNANEEMKHKQMEYKQYVLDALARYSFEESEYVFTIPTKPGKPLIFCRSFWDEQILMDFEGEKFFGPKEYDKILTQHYGNYMTPPPEKNRVSIHRTAVWEISN